MIPAFLKVWGLVKQHIDSFNYFINTDIKEIIRANSVIWSKEDKRFELRFLNIKVESPTIVSDGNIITTTPHECRIWDMTYSGRVLVDIEYTYAGVLVPKTIEIGRIPIMLGSSKCVLNGNTMAELASKHECPYDPRGYFIVKGTEKVMLI